MKVVILAGGRGRRLGYLTSGVPKPMLRMGSRPFLEHVILNLRRQGFHDFIFLCGYRHEVIRKHFEDGHRWGIRIRYSVENRPLGTGGAVRRAAGLLDSHRSFLLLNGDTYLKTDLKKMIRVHRKTGARVTMAVSKTRRETGKTARFGSVGLGPRHRVIRYAEKITGASPAYLNAGAYVVHPGILREIPAGRVYSLEKQLFPKLVGERFFGWPVRGGFTDIGTVASFRGAARKFPCPALP